MSHQLTFADSEFSTKRRQTRKEIFLFFFVIIINNHVARDIDLDDIKVS
nr:hypothetical protein [Klebsiella pneumoniae]